VHTQNINVELSQVEVYLPEEHSWYGFDGSMRRMDDVSEYEATSFSYQTKRTERLNEALSAGDEFTRIRALSNSVRLQSEVALQQSAQLSNSNRYVQEQLGDNRRAVDELRRNTENVERKLKENVSQSFTNPYRLAEEYRNQTLIVNPQADESATQIKSRPEPMHKFSSGSPQGTKFDQSWFESNKLADFEADRRAGEKRDGLAKDAKGEAQAGKRQADKPSEQSELKKALAPATPPATTMPSAGQGFVRGTNAYEKAAAPPAPKSEVTPRIIVQEETESLLRKKADQKLNQPAKPNDVVNRYQQQQAQPQRGVGGPSADLDIPIRQGSADKAGLLTAGLATTPPPAQGFASLDVDLPTRGQVYRFTTTRGDLRLSARAVSRHWFDGLARLGMVVAGIMVLWLMVRVLRNPSVVHYVDSTVCGGLLLIVGLLLMCSGLLPIVGVLATLGSLAIFARAVRRSCLATV
jgi:hypothetical protein